MAEASIFEAFNRKAPRFFMYRRRWDRNAISMYTRQENCFNWRNRDWYWGYWCHQLGWRTKEGNKSQGANWEDFCEWLEQTLGTPQICKGNRASRQVRVLLWTWKCHSERVYEACESGAPDAMKLPKQKIGDSTSITLTIRGLLYTMNQDEKLATLVAEQLCGSCFDRCWTARWSKNDVGTHERVVGRRNGCGGKKVKSKPLKIRLPRKLTRILLTQ